MITVMIGGVKVLCFKAFIGWGAFVMTFLGAYPTTHPAPVPPPPAAASTLTLGNGNGLPCRIIGGCR